MTATLMKIRQTKEIEVTGLGDRIKQARLASNKSLSQICRESGISRTYWYELEKEKIDGALTIEMLRRIEQILEVDFDVKID